MSASKKKEIPLAVIGYDFSHASSRWRSALPLNTEEKKQLYKDLQQNQPVNGIVFLDTCNRNEWIVSSEKPQWTSQLLKAHIIKRLQENFLDKEQIPHPFVLHGKEALLHILRVSSGLESFVQGEKQIAGQINLAFQNARKQKLSDTVLNRLSTLAGKTACETAGLGVFQPSIRGVHDLSVKYLMNYLKNNAPHNIVVVGYGEIARLTIDSLRYHSSWKIKICNRTIPNENPEQILSLSELPQVLENADAVIFASGAPTPLFTENLFLQIKPRLEKREKQLLAIDMGIPSQIEDSLKEKEKLQVANLDILLNSEFIDLINPDNLRKIENTIEQLAQEFITFINEREMVPVLQTAQNTHTKYIQEIIPTLLQDEFPELNEEIRSRLTFRLRGLIREYTNTIIETVHKEGKNYQVK